MNTANIPTDCIHIGVGYKTTAGTEIMHSNRRPSLSWAWGCNTCYWNNVLRKCMGIGEEMCHCKAERAIKLRYGATAELRTQIAVFNHRGGISNWQHRSFTPMCLEADIPKQDASIYEEAHYPAISAATPGWFGGLVRWQWLPPLLCCCLRRRTKTQGFTTNVHFMHTNAPNYMSTKSYTKNPGIVIFKQNETVECCGFEFRDITNNNRFALH